MTITIYHNPACGTSRNTLEMMRRSGETPEVIQYLHTPPSRETLVALIAAMATEACNQLRDKPTLAAVPTTVCTSPDWASTPIWAFMPKCH